MTDTIELPPRPAGRHTTDREGLRLEELQGVGPTVSLSGGAPALRERGVKVAGDGDVHVDLGLLLPSLVRECTKEEVQLLFRAMARAVKEKVPEAADYLETWGAG